ncbi:Vi polysaccharide biosynthesis UDP-N-acetylglucosamine C-6 dehydrogenase TviB [Epibacterium sp. Ofav1-8]|uniref:Vi polysaccharide biosynthesis UDP-N-acetylglucosamine C-6 dehydrogenase TviB n=1 Tax=Epibacterium sp. Ofav1-8 TaxID=2917735 RepID=UPI001EF585D6|nr:Vi polysaccharide biosynthesis UDP-N-acetylglucosamine C-6 dehydrogenase TviB [Epibacterium sp. Ofav1-8]MCG7625398.1 Vi polysaccharide biosynthesis UDP-N-acetylglucosamine C-6 dehydrogenase TviB [Epibacterium sp. Ofav1-8]
MTDSSPPGEKICVIGLGYVGLPLAVEFGRSRPVVGFDIDEGRIEELRRGVDRTCELDQSALTQACHLTLSASEAHIADAKVFIVTVPTPIDTTRRPDLGPLLAASRTVGRALKPGDTVIFESTVYPGATEEDCVPILEEMSGLTFNQDFGVGYSPERINPGDKTRRLPDIVKVTSGSSAATAEKVDALYASIITAGTHRAESIRVAEAAKVIENSQRDINIALINELAMIFNRMEIDTEAVLRAAATKWNFLNFRPGLVGGHCIGVDPYYLTHKAQEVGYHPEILLSGRRLNDGMGAYVAQQMIKAMLQRRVHVVDARVLVMGLAFKENCPDLRNTRVVDVISGLQEFGVAVDVFDPHVDPAEARDEYGLELLSALPRDTYDGVVLAVAHEEFRQMGSAEIRALGKPGAVLYDLKYLLAADETDLRL